MREEMKSKRKFTGITGMKRIKEKDKRFFLSLSIPVIPVNSSIFIIVQLWLILLVLNSPAQTYTNPVIAGDFPDPSVIRVGEDYYATATAGGWSPVFSIAHSRDLVNWKIVGSVFPNKPTWAKGDFWAPEIAADKGKFYIFYTARRDEGKGKKGTLCVAVAVADKPDGNYVDKGALVCQGDGFARRIFYPRRKR